MATVTGLTAERMLEIEAGTVVDGSIVGDNLILEKHDGSTVDAGNVRGPAGPAGPAIPKVTAFPGSPTDGDVVIRTDLPNDPMYIYADTVWIPTGGIITQLYAPAAAMLNGWVARTRVSMWTDGKIATILSMMLNGAAKTGGSSEIPFQVPAGLRPLDNYQVPAGRAQPGAYNSPVSLEIQVGTGGNVTVSDANESALSASQATWTMINSFSYPLV